MRNFLRFLIGVSIFLGLAVGVARLVAIRWWRVPDDDPVLEASISPTLQGGDWIILWRLTPPHMGDLVLCPEPQTPERPVIARVAGDSGDTVAVSGNLLTVNGRRVKNDSGCSLDVFTTIDPQTRLATEQRCEMEELGGQVHPRGNVTERQVVPEVSKTRVESGKLFLLSDNRLFPYDSREFGLADRATCKETVVFRIVGKAGFSDVATRWSLIH